MSYTSTFAACARKCRRPEFSPGRLNTVSGTAEAIVCSTRSTLSSRPRGGLITAFRRLAGSSPVTRSPVSASPKLTLGLGRTAHCSTERPSHRSEPNYGHCATAEQAIRVAPECLLVQQAGWQPRTSWGLAHPAFTHPMRSCVTAIGISRPPHTASCA